jgi:hypothetical protein
MRTIVLAVLLGIAGPLSAASLNLQFNEQTITVHDATPGARVLLFGVTRDVLRTHPVFVGKIIESQFLTDADGDGLVIYDLGKSVPQQGIWVAVDMSSGQYVAAPSPGYEPVVLPLTSDAAKHDNAGQLKKIEWPVSEADLLVVRPGMGAWHLYASRSSELDENKSNNGPLRLDVEAMQSIGDSPAPPKNLKKGDIVAIFNPRRMRYGVLEVKP